jgi:uncharacterized protein
MRILASFFIGLLFGVGLVVAGMSDPAKVLNFLDVAAIRTGNWDASLAFVMAGAVVVTFIGYRLVLRRQAPVMGKDFDLPTSVSIDRRLVLGSALFGVGWGLAGLCPGPAFTALASGQNGAYAFMASMVAGMFAARTAGTLTSPGAQSAGR